MALVDTRPTWVVYGVNSHSHDGCTIDNMTNNNPKSLVPQHLFLQQRSPCGKHQMRPRLQPMTKITSTTVI